jgi:hypothetical protein
VLTDEFPYFSNSSSPEINHMVSLALRVFAHLLKFVNRAEELPYKLNTNLEIRAMNIV